MGGCGKIGGIDAAGVGNHEAAEREEARFQSFEFGLEFGCEEIRQESAGEGPVGTVAAMGSIIPFMRVRCGWLG